VRRRDEGTRDVRGIRSEEEGGREERSLDVRAAAEFVAPIEVRTRPAATLKTRARPANFTAAETRASRVRSSSAEASVEDRRLR